MILLHPWFCRINFFRLIDAAPLESSWSSRKGKYIKNSMNWNSRSGLLLAISAAALTMAVVKAARADSAPLGTVPSVDLKRYTGTWYEIARYPNRFQRKCSSDTTAVYTLRDDGKIKVVNSCKQSDGKADTANGTAKVVDRSTNAKLKVTFFWPFSGDYWIIGLGKDYEYAIVGEPSRKYLWILSRTPQMSPQLYEETLQVVRDKGYDPAKLMLTKQGS